MYLNSENQVIIIYIKFTLSSQSVLMRFISVGKLMVVNDMPLTIVGVNVLLEKLESVHSFILQYCSCKCIYSFVSIMLSLIKFMLIFISLF